MSVFETLKNEHQLIRRYLNNVAVVLELMEEEKLPAKEFFELGLDFCKMFADKFHHFKEEYEMFMLLAQKKEGKIDDQIAFLRDQHERSRNFTSEIAKSLDGYDRGDSYHIGNIKEFLGYYNLLLRQHIHREDHEFYPMAKEVFDEEDLNKLSENFEKAEQKVDSGFFEQYESKVSEMEDLLKEQFGNLYENKINTIAKYHVDTN